MWCRIVIASAGVLGFMATVSACDLAQKAEAVLSSPAPQVSWAGFYIGANGAYGWSARHPDTHIVDLGSSGTDRLDAAQSSGGFGGVKADYNWPGILDPGLVLGIEADLACAGIASTFKASPAVPLEAHRTLNSFETPKGRLDYAWDQGLFYAKGGVAFGGVEESVLHKANLGQSFYLDNTATPAAYVPGGGVGLILTQDWSLKVDYRPLRFENLSTIGTFAGGAVPDAVRISDLGFDYHTIKAGLNDHVLFDPEITIFSMLPSNGRG